MREWCKTIFCSLLDWYPLYKTVYYALIFDVYRSCFKSDFDSKVLTNAKKTIKTELKLLGIHLSQEKLCYGSLFLILLVFNRWVKHPKDRIAFNYDFDNRYLFKVTFF